MHPFGLIALLQFLWEHEIPSLFVLVALGLLLSVVFLCYRNQTCQDAPATLPHFTLSHIASFMKQRHDFLAWGFKVTNQRLFQFRLLRNNVVVVSGEQGRKDFFNAKGLDIHEAFAILTGDLPLLYGVTTERRRQLVAKMYKRLSNVQRNERLTDLIPEVLNDCRRHLQSWEKAGSLDPFEKIYELTFQATVRCLTCTEIADEPKLVARCKQLFEQVERGITPATVLFPWFPSPSMVMRARATKQLYDIIVNTMKVRKQSGVPRNDTLQIFLDSEDELATVMGFMMGFVTAGSRTTGTSASWLFIYLGCHPKWRHEARAEVKKLITSHSLETVSECNSNSPPRDSSSTALSSIPLSAWENETPVLDTLIREAIRLSQAYVASRRNIGPDMYIDGKVIPTGALVVYPVADVHLDPTLYPDPWKFDPARPQPKCNLTYLGWGGGRTTCIGSRLARLNIKLIAALLLVDFDFDTVDVSGRIVDSPPKPNWNDPVTCRPAQGQVFLKYKRLDNPEPPSS
ncbi:cytochrome P450 [Russula ochroleuca]|uniref:Cytochrome P450 n=1 Tax=Russula ochroleuca TaxID=152965 RepID=A0A9P5MK45_9AGAM|nr:cytochrome P450 [Russula ochroleuca]